jgi:hypothetical protein
MSVSPDMSRGRGILVLWSLQFEVCVVWSEVQWDVWLDKRLMVHTDHPHFRLVNPIRLGSCAARTARMQGIAVEN